MARSACRRGEAIGRLVASKRFQEVREVLSLAPAGLITDVDGTIARIAPTPSEVQIAPACRDALASLASSLALVAVVTGRDALTARQMVGLDTMVYVGNFGLDRWEDGKVTLAAEAVEYLPRVRELVLRLQDGLAMPGMVVEDKGATVSVHYRLAGEPALARDTILRLLERTPEAQGMTIAEGKLVVEVRPPVDLDKGIALERLVEERGLAGVISLGDDTSDVAAFKALHSLTSRGICRGLAVGVLGLDAPPELEREADLLLDGVGEVEELLQGLAGV